MNRCKFCGNTTYYRIVKYSGRGLVHYNFDGSDTDNDHMHDGVNYSENKSIFCSNCREKLGTIDNLTPQQ